MSVYSITLRWDKNIVYLVQKHAFTYCFQNFQSCLKLFVTVRINTKYLLIVSEYSRASSRCVVLMATPVSITVAQTDSVGVQVAETIRGTSYVEEKVAVEQ